MRKWFEDVGLPPGHGFPELTYHALTSSVIVLTRPKERQLPCKRLSIRKANEAKYTEVVTLPENISVKSFVLSKTLPAMFFITNKVEKHERRGILSTLGLPHQELEPEPIRYMADWDALYCYDLNAGKHDVIARNGELHTAGEFSRAWLCEVLDVNNDTGVLYVKSGIERGGLVDYHISSLNLSGLFLTPITKLEAVFA
jgi:hypothetical protein